MKKLEVNKKRENISEIKQEMLALLFNNQELMTELRLLNVDDETIANSVGALSEYVETKSEVAKCLKAGKCLHKDYFHNYSLRFDKPYISLVPTACPAFQNSHKVRSRLKFNDFPGDYFNVNIEDLPSRRNFAPYLKSLVGMLKGEINAIYACGETGIGSLNYAVSFLKKTLEIHESATGGVFNLPSFIREYAGDYYNNKLEIDNYLSNLISVDYLIIDRFGNEETNKLIRDAIIYPLISERISLKKPTIILSELTLDEVKRLYDYTGQEVRANQIINTIRGAIKEEIYLTGTKF